VKLIAGKVVDAYGGGTWSGIVAGIDYVTNQKIKNRSIPTVINMSLGAPKLKFVNDAVDAASRQGVIVVVAAGNSYFDDACNYSPAGASKAIAVGATDKYDNAADFTNVGRCVDIFA
jgi:subtilisin family serine protease